MREKKKVKKVEIRAFSPKVDLFFSILIALFAISCLIPFIFVIIISLTGESALTANGYSFFPKEWSFEAYKYIFLETCQLKLYAHLE